MRRRNVAIAICLAAISVAGALYLLCVQFADGSAYPEYSTLRSDPVGAKLLYDTLAFVPGTTVARNYLPLEYLGGTGATVLLLNQNPELFDQEGSTRHRGPAGRAGKPCGADNRRNHSVAKKFRSSGENLESKIRFRPAVAARFQAVFCRGNWLERD